MKRGWTAARLRIQSNVFSGSSHTAGSKTPKTHTDTHTLLFSYLCRDFHRLNLDSVLGLGPDFGPQYVECTSSNTQRLTMQQFSNHFAVRLTLFINYIVSRQTGPHSEINIISSLSLILISCNHIWHSIKRVSAYCANLEPVCKISLIASVPVFHFFDVLCNIEGSYIRRSCLSSEIACCVSQFRPRMSNFCVIWAHSNKTKVCRGCFSLSKMVFLPDSMPWDDRQIKTAHIAETPTLHW